MPWAEKRGLYDAAGREYEAVLAEHPDDLDSMRNVAIVDKYLIEYFDDEPAEGLRRAQRAVDLDSRRLARRPDQQTRLDTAISLAQLASVTPAERERLPLYERSLALREQVVAEDPANRFARILVRRSNAQVARSRYRLGDMSAAVAAAERTLPLFASDEDATDGERHWRGWARFILVAETASRRPQADTCTRLRQATDDLRTVPSLFPETLEPLRRVQAKVPGCVLDLSVPSLQPVALR